MSSTIKLALAGLVGWEEEGLQLINEAAGVAASPVAMVGAGLGA